VPAKTVTRPSSNWASTVTLLTEVNVLPLSQTATIMHDNEKRKKQQNFCRWILINKLGCGLMPNVMAAQPNIGGALCESSIISFVVPRYNVWLTAAARVPCSNAANTGERKTWTQSDFCSW